MRTRDVSGWSRYGQAAWEKYFEAADEILANNSTDWDKAVAVGSYINQHIKYAYIVEDLEGGEFRYPDLQLSCCGIAALITGRGVCQGFANSFSVLANLVGLECKVVRCEMRGEGHAINRVCIDGTWYYYEPQTHAAVDNFTVEPLDCWENISNVPTTILSSVTCGGQSMLDGAFVAGVDVIPYSWDYIEFVYDED